MNKKSIAILLVASSFASSAFATSIVNKLITKHSSTTPSIIKTHETIKQNNRSYTDFSGTWIPNCGDGPDSPVVIENGASYIAFDGDFAKIGRGLQGKYEFNENEAWDEHTSLEWNADGYALVVKNVSVAKNNVDNSAIKTNISRFTLTMKNGQINLDGKYTMFEDETQVEQPTTVHCVYTKKQ